MKNLSSTQAGVPSQAEAAQASSARVGTLTPAQWAVIQSSAEAAGDGASAAVAARYAAKGSSSGIEARGLGGIGKATVKAALKHGYQDLPKTHQALGKQDSECP